VLFASYTRGNGNAIVVTDRRGRHRRVLVPKRENVEVTFPRVSPEGRRLLFGRHIGDRYAIFVADRDGRHARQLTGWGMNGGDADWSPDGRWILFRSGVPGATRSQLYLIRPDASARRRLTKPGVAVTSSASFSPDGKLIVYAASGGGGGQPDLFVLRRSGTAVRRLTRTPVAENAPDWGRGR
jgi:Tol biopolymer transport system component